MIQQAVLLLGDESIHIATNAGTAQQTLHAYSANLVSYAEKLLTRSYTNT